MCSDQHNITLFDISRFITDAVLAFKSQTLGLTHMQISPSMCTDQHTCNINLCRSDNL